MITSIYIRNIATFSGEGGNIDNLKELNFFYGANGSGKTTISRVLANKDFSASSQIFWENGEQEEILVYNRDFVNKNFSGSSEIPGIYTMGEEIIETEKQMSALRRKYQNLHEEKSTKLNGIPEGEIEEYFNEKHNECRKSYEDKLWQLKELVKGTEMDGFLKGYKGSKSLLFNQLIDQYKNNQEEFWSKEQIIDYVNKKNNIALQRVSLIPYIQDKGVNVIEEAPVFKETIIGKNNSQISDLIQKLGNSQWVLQGKAYMDNSEGKCPFCQQTLPLNFSKVLESYFDHTYTENMKSIAQYKTNYSSYVEYIIKEIEDLKSLSEMQYKYLDMEKIEGIKDAFIDIFEENQLKISEKLNIPGNSIELSKSNGLMAEINGLIHNANDEITKHNENIEGKISTKNIHAIFWRYAAKCFENDIKNYFHEDRGISSECNALKKNIQHINDQLRTIQREIEKLEEKQISIAPTVTKINQILQEFGFTGFRLSVANDGIQYQIVRSNGVPAEKTLSEGEANFITFLYFYFMLAGSTNKTNTPRRKIIVIDDPVSSMDSQVLYIVGTLIKDLSNEVVKEDADYTQLFLLTHNVYFFNEVVTYMGNIKKKRSGKNVPACSYYTIRKKDDDSLIDYYATNPIKTTYQMLWDFVKEARKNIGEADRIVLLNVLRRILEYYFRTLGNYKIKEIYGPMKGKELYICRSLLAIENSQSHSFIDDIVNTTPDVDTLQKYLEVFKEIFQNTGNINHYNMMMGINEEEHD